MGRIYFILTWYIASLATFVFALLFFVHITLPQTIEAPTQHRYQQFRSLPSDLVNLNTHHLEQITHQDGRALLIKNFFEQYNSPLKANADDFVKTADQYSLDYRLLPSISMQESSGGKRLPEGSFNPFGYGIYGDNVLKFNSYAEAIDRVGRGLKSDYIDKGLTDPYKIMAKYTPPSLEKGGPWAIGVTTFMEELK